MSTTRSSGPMRTLTTTRQLRKGQSGICRPALKSSTAECFVDRSSASPLLSRHARHAPLSTDIKNEIKLAARTIRRAHRARRRLAAEEERLAAIEQQRLAALEERRLAAQLKLQQARLQLISQNRRLEALPLKQNQVPRTIVQPQEVITPISFRNQFTYRSSSLSQTVCTCSTTSAAPSSSSWSDDEDMDCDFEVPADWGLSSAQLAEYGLIGSTCFCSDFVDLPALRRSLPQSVLLRIAMNGQQPQGQQGRNDELARIWYRSIQRAMALDLPF